MYNSIILTKNLKREMDRHGYSGRELSRRAGLELDAVNKILRGSHADPTVSKIMAIASVLECSVDELLGHTPYLEGEQQPEVNEEYFKFAVNMALDKMRSDDNHISPGELTRSVYNLYHKLMAETGKTD